MSRRSLRLGLILTLCAGSMVAQEALRQQIQSIAAAAHGRVSVACSLPGTPLNCDLDSNAHPPMQSVFKLPLGLTILHQVEEGKLSLEQPVRFLPEDRILPTAYSPLQSKFPNAGVDVSLRELLQMTVSLSDNVAADMLLRIGGGPKRLETTSHHLESADFIWWIRNMCCIVKWTRNIETGLRRREQFNFFAKLVMTHR